MPDIKLVRGGLVITDVTFKDIQMGPVDPGYLADGWEGSHIDRVYAQEIRCAPDPEDPEYWVAKYGPLSAKARAPWRAVAFLNRMIADQLLADNAETPLED